MFMICEAQCVYEYRSMLEDEQFTTCLTDCHDLLAAACVGKNGYLRQISDYSANEEDPRARYVSWAIFEVLWAVALN